MSQLSFGPLALDRDDFLCVGPSGGLSATGCRQLLPSGALASLEQRASAFFTADKAAAKTADKCGPDYLVGAVPYDRDGVDALFQPERILGAPRPAEALPSLPPAAMQIVAEPNVSHYRAAVAEAVDRITRQEFEKIVLSRSLKIRADRDHDLGALVAAMRQDALATVFSVPLPPVAGRARHLVGATPELLIERRADMVFSHPLAGSAKRSADPIADQAAAAALFASDKNRREHRIAAEHVLDTLAPYCATLGAPQGMALTSTAAMWHLGTRIEGRLRDPETSCAALLAALHPTPAVCGLPVVPAEAALPGLEGYDRGFYAGAVGWLRGNGDGCWYLALRCAEVSGPDARLYAGAGIVAGSDPEAEAQETSAKFLAMLAAFGLDEQGNLTSKE